MLQGGMRHGSHDGAACQATGAVMRSDAAHMHIICWARCGRRPCTGTVRGQAWLCMRLQRLYSRMGLHSQRDRACGHQGLLGHHATLARLFCLKPPVYPCPKYGGSQRRAYRDCRASSKSCLQTAQIWEGSGVHGLPMPAATAPTTPARELGLQQSPAGSMCTLPDMWLLEECLG